MDIFSVAVHVALPHLRLCRVHLNSFLEMVHSRLKTIVEPLQEHELPMPKGCRFQLDSFQKPFNLGRQDDHGTRRTGTAAGWVLASRKGAEPSTIQRLAHQLSQQMDILCLDEVSITNLQNCVVLGPLIRALCDHGVILIATSNKAPHDLYEGGIDRDLHLPILTAAICDNCDIMPHASNVDYRALLEAANAESQVFRWHCASERDGDTFVDTWWAALSGSDRMESVPVGYGRSLPVMQSSCQGCVRFDFRDLCTYPPVALGSADYTEICSRFHTLLVSNVPRLRPESADAARRWTLLVDSCYENHIRLILSTAADDPDDLIRLTSGDGDGSDGQSLQEASFAISRCTSRLREMQSKLYQDACRIRLE
jgi:cell division protein ZapE